MPIIQTMPEHFPDDENGNVLRLMQRDGDDLSASRDVEFSVVFRSHGDAQAFAFLVERLALKTSVEDSGCRLELPWDVVVTKHMVPTHAEITEFEALLEDLAAPLGGENDGWGCFSQPVRH